MQEKQQYTINDINTSILTLKSILNMYFYVNPDIISSLINIPDLDTFNIAYDKTTNSIMAKIKKTYLKKKFNTDVDDTRIYYHLFGLNLLQLIREYNMVINFYYEGYNCKIPLDYLLNQDTINLLFNVSILTNNVVCFRL